MCPTVVAAATRARRLLRSRAKRRGRTRVYTRENVGKRRRRENEQCTVKVLRKKTTQAADKKRGKHGCSHEAVERNELGRTWS